jgi:hypothetical protein
MHSLHLPLTLINTGRFVASFPSQGLNGCKSCNLSLFGSTATLTLARSFGGRWKVSCPGSYPFGGSSLPEGCSNVNGLPSEPIRLSFKGLNDKVPAKANAVTISGEATNAWVAGLASLRPVKFRLYDVTTFSMLYQSGKATHGEESYPRTSVLFAFLDISSIPLPNTRSASIRENETTDTFKYFNLTVSGDGGANLFRAWCDRKSALDF